MHCEPACDVSAMHGEHFFRLVLKHMRRPQRAVDSRTQIFELGGKAAIDHADAIKNAAM